MSTPFSVKIHLVQGSSNALRARADVQGQKMTFNGFTVLEGKSGLFVKPPSMKSGSGWLSVIEFADKNLEKMIAETVLKAYREALSTQGASTGDTDGNAF